MPGELPLEEMLKFPTVQYIGALVLSNTSSLTSLVRFLALATPKFTIFLFSCEIAV